MDTSLNIGHRTADTGLSIGVAGASLVAVTYGLARYGYGLYVPLFARDFGMSARTLGLVASGGYAGYLTAVLGVGVLSGRMGARFFVVLAGLSAAAGMGVVAVANSPAALAAGVVLAGTSSGWAWAPYAQVVASGVPPRWRSRALSLISSGTSVGVVVVGAAALLVTTEAWRVLWGGFALAAVGVAVWNARVVPSVRTASRAGSLWRHRNVPDARRLGLAALGYGLVGSVYWTFAIHHVSGGDLAHRDAWLWIVIGATGMAGAATGRLVRRWGAAAVFVAVCCALSAGVLVLALSPSRAGALVSAACYGAGFMMMAALLSLWSGEVFSRTPTRGFSGVVVLLGIGSVVGPGTAGTVAEWTDERWALLGAGVIAVLLTTVRPRFRSANDVE